MLTFHVNGYLNSSDKNFQLPKAIAMSKLLGRIVETVLPVSQIFHALTEEPS